MRSLHREEHVLTVPRDVLVGAGLQTGLINDQTLVRDILHVISDSGDFIPRSKAERDVSLLQPIPCAVLTAGAGFLTLKRHEADKRKGLHNKYVVWLGGHVRQEDCTEGYKSILLSALFREINEEIGIPLAEFSCLLGLIVPHNSLHFAVLFESKIADNLISGVAPNGEFRTYKARQKAAHFSSISQLADRFKDLDLWSQIIVRDIYNWRVRPSQTSQMALPSF